MISQGYSVGIYWTVVVQTRGCSPQGVLILNPQKKPWIFGCFTFFRIFWGVRGFYEKKGFKQ